MSRTACTEPQCLYKGALYCIKSLTLIERITWAGDKNVIKVLFGKKEVQTYRNTIKNILHLIPRGKMFLLKVIIIWMVTRFPTLNGTKFFATIFAGTRYRPLCSVRRLYCMMRDFRFLPLCK